MDKNSNMFEAVVNIDSYLDIVVDHNERKNDPLLYDGYQEYDDCDSCKMES
jgi:hypothetical protein